ncbi:MAG: DNA-binding protein [Candidatus Aenigmatarchaeota archaeon]
MNNNEDEIRKALLQRRMQETMAQQDMEKTIKIIMQQILEPAARERLNNLKIVKAELATQLQIYLVQLHQMGQIPKRITESQLIEMLKKISEKKDFKIKYK